jgi:predicted nucleotidyltransferase
MKASDVRKYSFEEICDIVGSVAVKYGVEKVYLFGSRAREDGNEGSDYDFFIIPGKLRGLIRLSGLINDLADALGSDVDVIPEGSVSETFTKEIFRDRRLVYEA